MQHLTMVSVCERTDQSMQQHLEANYNMKIILLILSDLRRTGTMKNEHNQVKFHAFISYNVSAGAVEVSDYLPTSRGKTVDTGFNYSVSKSELLGRGWRRRPADQKMATGAV